MATKPKAEGMGEGPLMSTSALWYARNGLPVFPLHWPTPHGCSCGESDCDSPGKHPRTRHGFKDATTDEARIAAWWNKDPSANIGIPTGRASGLVVIDCDPRNGGPAERGQLIQRFGSIPETPEVVSGGGGRHFYFRYEGGSIPKTLAEGIDLKGEGGYVVAPPSLHASGMRYEVDGIEGAAAFLRIAEIPSWLRDYIATSAESPSDNGTVPHALPEMIPDGTKHYTIVSIIGSLKRRGAPKEAAFAACRALNFESQVSDDDIRERVESCYRLYPTPGLVGRKSDGAEEPPDPGATPETGRCWPDLIPLGSRAKPPLEIDMLCGPLREHAGAVAQSTETPLELAALLDLAATSASIAGKLEVSPEQGYVEPVNLYIAVALDSGSRKTSVYKRSTAPLLEWDLIQSERLAPIINRTKSERKTQEARVERLRKAAAEAKSQPDAERIISEVAHLEANLPAVPVAPRTWTQDVTPEKLAVLTAEQGGRMAVFSDEGGLFDIFAGRYSGGEPNIDFLLQAHSGSPCRVDRASRPPVFIERPSLVIGMSPQPDVLRALGRKPGFRGRGLVARFLYALPDSAVGYRSLQPYPMPVTVERAYREMIHRLLDIEMPDKPTMLTFSPSSYDAWKDFQRAIELMMREGGKLAHMCDWGSKLPGAAARIAAVQHCAAGLADKPQIDLDTTERSLALATVLIGNAVEAFGLMDEDPVIEQARRLLKWITRSDHTRFTLRDCFCAHQSRFKRVQDMRPPLQVLIEHGYIRPIEAEKVAHRPSEYFEVNPKIRNEVNA